MVCRAALLLPHLLRGQCVAAVGLAAAVVAIAVLAPQAEASALTAAGPDVCVKNQGMVTSDSFTEIESCWSIHAFVGISVHKQRRCTVM